MVFCCSGTLGNASLLDYIGGLCEQCCISIYGIFYWFVNSRDSDKWIYGMKLCMSNELYQVHLKRQKNLTVYFFFHVCGDSKPFFFFACAASELITVNLYKVAVTELNYYVDSFLSR